MQTVQTVQELRQRTAQARQKGQVIGLVPTMGALHAGHLSLVRAARQSCDLVVVSIFVNPTQFGPKEDFSKYPRTLEKDSALLAEAGVDVLFAPSIDEIYPPGASTFVEVEGLSERLDGASRPGHFRGVATVVSKLFLMAAPHRAFFGQKDAAQVAVLRKMVRDLHFDLQLVVCPIVRDADGLALSSRNAYLSKEERRQALVLSRSLHCVEKLVKQGAIHTEELIAAAEAVFAQEPEVRIDYIAAVHPDTLEAVTGIQGEILFAVAAWVGSTRLIDNLLLSPRI
jgi:pantoate--beta-alanine ligase